MAFIGRRDMFVLEKASGKVQRVINGVVQTTPALDLAVNSNSERGLLSIALHPRFPRNPRVYLYWTESTAVDAAGATIDTTDAASTPLLGNRVDSFIWNGTALRHERNLIKLRAFQADAGQPLRGNHNGGIIRFEVGDDDHRDRGDRDHGDHHDGFTFTRSDDDSGRDGDRDDDRDNDRGDGRDDDRDKARLFIIIGDNGRRGQTQNLEDGPFGPGTPDDQFGGPRPDNAHLTGVVLRLNDDGTTPRDNPFFQLGRRIGGEVGANIQKIFAYGVRNSFGMAVDPRTGTLWNQENGDDSFDEINRITAGQNNGWVQMMGPVGRVAEFKMIESTPPFVGLQQIRWPPANIADTPAEALSRLFMLRGAHYRDPQFSWKYAIAPAAIGFHTGRALGRQYRRRPVRRRRAAHARRRDTCCASTCRRAAAVWRCRIRAWRIASPTTRPSSIRPRARRFASGRGSASGPISSPGPTATCSWCRSVTAPSTRSTAASWRLCSLDT